MQRPIVFLHVMKCGGTAVRRGLALGIAGERHGPDVFELDGLAADRSSGGTTRDQWRFRDQLLSYVLATEPPPLVMGHFRYAESHEDLLDRASFITILRDPIDRLTSLYKYRRYKDDVRKPVGGTLEEYVETAAARREGHHMVWLFCGDPRMDPRSDEAIESAVSNLRRFASVELLVHMDRLAETVSQLAGRPVEFPLRNPRPAPPGAPSGPTDAVRSVMAEVCRPDIELVDALFGAR